MEEGGREKWVGDGWGEVRREGERAIWRGREGGGWVGELVHGWVGMYVGRWWVGQYVCRWMIGEMEGGRVGEW